MTQIPDESGTRLAGRTPAGRNGLQNHNLDRDGDQSPFALIVTGTLDQRRDWLLDFLDALRSMYGVDVLDRPTRLGLSASIERLDRGLCRASSEPPDAAMVILRSLVVEFLPLWARVRSHEAPSRRPTARRWEVQR